MIFKELKSQIELRLEYKQKLKILIKGLKLYKIRSYVENKKKFEELIYSLS